ncbi:hypothetical protein [Candidatus Macondimonas diazotrophica]|uniref:Uncharacterized protein n=1 Tax=Candidatus Macondimonas diazotrophica TaxID=2305248 RepID=A0A4Z0F5Y2_9GAMM|nr:hypothetical protein [Candidatus Macondimonas diazotrophica]TFZ81643.1 hypothetical protein E4680_11715 [Candidatus Macondimonas diazotrophica]
MFGREDAYAMFRGQYGRDPSSPAELVSFGRGVLKADLERIGLTSDQAHVVTDRLARFVLTRETEKAMMVGTEFCNIIENNTDIPAAKMYDALAGYMRLCWKAYPPTRNLEFSEADTSVPDEITVCAVQAKLAGRVMIRDFVSSGAGSVFSVVGPSGEVLSCVDELEPGHAVILCDYQDDGEIIENDIGVGFVVKFVRDARGTAHLFDYLGDNYLLGTPTMFPTEDDTETVMRESGILDAAAYLPEVLDEVYVEGITILRVA